MVRSFLYLAAAVFFLSSCSWMPGRGDQGTGELWGNEGYIFKGNGEKKTEDISKIREETAKLKEKLEAERKDREEAERKAKLGTERQAKLEADRKAKEEAERQAKLEADRKAREEAERARKRAELESKQIKENTCPDVTPPVLIADFNSGEKPNNLGGDFGAWDRDPNDYTQTATESFISDIKCGTKKGFHYRFTMMLIPPSLLITDSG